MEGRRIIGLATPFAASVVKGPQTEQSENTDTMGNEDFAYGHLARGNVSLDLGLDDFLNYGQSDGDSGDSVVLNWKRSIDENHGSTLAWLHTLAPFTLVNRHNWHECKEIEDRESGSKRVEVFSQRFVCHEHPDIVKQRKYRFSSRQDRSYPAPQSCPFDLMLDLVFQLVQSGKLPWTEPLFRFAGEGSNRKTEDVTIYAAGFYGGYGEKNMDPRRIDELKRARIRRDAAWTQDGRAKTNYLIQVVEHEKASMGTRLIIDGDGFKGAMADAINKERTRRRDNKLMPIGASATPFPFMFEYDKTQKFDQRYSAAAMGDELTPAVRAVIFDRSKVIDTSDYTRKGDPEELYASVQEHCLVNWIDWGPCFKDAVARVAVPVDAPVGGDGGEEAAHLFSCSACGKATMRAEDYTCDPDAGGCGAVYVDILGADNQPSGGVRLAKRPCTKCGTLIELPESPTELNEKGEEVACSKCGTKHFEMVETRASRPCENPECDALVSLSPGAACGKCGREHEFGEQNPEPALPFHTAWIVVAETKPATTAPKARGATARGAAARGSAAVKA